MTHTHVHSHIMWRAKQVWGGVNTWAGCYMSTDRYRSRSTRSMHTFEARRKITAALPYRANSLSIRIRQLMEIGKNVPAHPRRPPGWQLSPTRRSLPRSLFSFPLHHSSPSYRPRTYRRWTVPVYATPNVFHNRVQHGWHDRVACYCYGKPMLTAKGKRNMPPPPKKSMQL